MHFATYNNRNREGDAGAFIYFWLRQNLKGEILMKNRVAYWQKVFLREKYKLFYTYQNKEPDMFLPGKDQKYMPVFHLVFKTPFNPRHTTHIT